MLNVIGTVVDNQSDINKLPVQPIAVEVFTLYSQSDAWKNTFLDLSVICVQSIVQRIFRICAKWLAKTSK